MKDFLRDALYFIALAIAGKVVTDSLPPIGIKELWRYFLRFFAFFAYLFGLLILLILILTSYEKNPQKALQQVFIYMLLFISMTLLYESFTSRLKIAKTAA